MRGCDVEGCNRPHHAKGLCQSHYKRGRNAEVKTHRFSERPEMNEAERLLGLGLSLLEVAKLVDTDRWTIARNFPERPGRTAKTDKYYELLPLVQSGVSLNEIRRTTGSDYRTVRRYFPHYRPFEVGGGGRANDIRESNRKLHDMDQYGSVRRNRDAGFERRGDK